MFKQINKEENKIKAICTIGLPKIPTPIKLKNHVTSVREKLVTNSLLKVKELKEKVCFNIEKACETESDLKKTQVILINANVVSH